MKYVTTPPKENTKGDFPVLNRVVTVENCYYYLSLMERFVLYKETFDAGTLKVMLARAELRYIKWREVVENAFSKSGNKPFTPPLDVAYMWHAHMLSPFRYYEDSVRLNQSRVFQVNLPLASLFNSAFAPIKEDVEFNWQLYYGAEEPYVLTPQNAVLGKTAIECSFCKSSMECSWIEYANWRHDPNVGIKCHKCRNTTTIGTTSLNCLKYDVEKRSYLIAGTLLDHKGSIKHRKRFNLQKTMSYCVREAETESPEGQLLRPSRSLEEMERKMKDICASPGTPSIFRASIKPLTHAIRGCYHNNPSPLSLDMIQAVGRQHEFNLKAVNIVNWSIPYGIARGIRQYNIFLKMIKANPLQIMVPTLEIDLAWHTHMLHPNRYRSFSITHIGRLINHDDNIPPEKLNMYAKATDKAWRQKIGHNLINGDKSEKSKMRILGRLRDAFSSGFGYQYQPGTLPDSLAEDAIRNVSNQMSYHNRRSVRALFGLTPKNSETLQSQLDVVFHNSGYGYTGTINCGASSVGKMGRKGPEIIPSTALSSRKSTRWALYLSTPFYGLPFLVDLDDIGDGYDMNIDYGGIGNSLGELMEDIISNTASTCGAGCVSGGGCGSGGCGGGGGGCGGGGGGGGGGCGGGGGGGGGGGC